MSSSFILILMINSKNNRERQNIITDVSASTDFAPNHTKYLLYFVSSSFPEYLILRNELLKLSPRIHAHLSSLETNFESYSSSKLVKLLKINE